MSNEHLHTTPFEHAYITGLLTLEHKSLREIGRKGLLPCHPHHAAYRLALDPHPHQASLQALQRVLQTGYRPKALLGDARMLKASTHPGLLSLGVGAVHRVRKDLKVCYQGQWLRADELAAQRRGALLPGFWSVR